MIINDWSARKAKLFLLDLSTLLLLFHLLRAILLTVHEDRLPSQTGKKKSLLPISRREQAIGASQSDNGGS